MVVTLPVGGFRRCGSTPASQVCVTAGGAIAAGPRGQAKQQQEAQEQLEGDPREGQKVVAWNNKNISLISEARPSFLSISRPLKKAGKNAWSYQFHRIAPVPFSLSQSLSARREKWPFVN